jgi:hypothetical protein
MCKAKLIVVIKYLTLIPTILILIMQSAHAESELQKLENTYGLRIELPTSWSLPPHGVRNAADIIFGSIWLFPESKTELLSGRTPNEYFIVQVRRAGVTNGHALLCNPNIGKDYADELSEEINNCCEPIDIRTGHATADLLVSRYWFFGTRAPQFRVSKSDSLSENELLACQYDFASIRPNGLVAAASDIFSSHYIFIIQLYSSPVMYPKRAIQLNQILRSIRIRCGKDGKQWCKAKPVRKLGTDPSTGRFRFRVGDDQ